MAAQLTFYGEVPGAVSPPPYTNAFQRTFESSRALELSPVAGLSLRCAAGRAWLSWQPQTNGSGYQVEFSGKLNAANWWTATNWSVLGFPTTNSFSEALAPTQRFYRVFLKP